MKTKILRNILRKKDFLINNLLIMINNFFKYIYFLKKMKKDIWIKIL